VSVLDTTFFIDLFRRDTDAALLWESLRRGEEAAADSTVTVFELWRGRLSLEEGDFYSDLMLVLEEIALSGAAARQAASWLRNLPASSAERLIRDAMVAASAAERGEPIYTRNHRDFSRFEGIQVLGY
jgi:predicted nucleic acid-binding protein